MEKHQIGLHIDSNSLSDKGNGLIQFPGGLTITDGTEMKSGTRYDIKSMVLDEYNGNVTADHMPSITQIIGKVGNTVKDNGRVYVDSIKFAVKQSPLAKLAYDLIRAKEQYVTDFSVETYGPPADEEGVYYGARLVGLSAVVVGNNNSATLKAIKSSLDEAQEQGLDTTELQKVFNVTTNHKETAMSDEDKAKAEAAEKEKQEQALKDKAEQDAKARKEDRESLLTDVKDMIKESFKPFGEQLNELKKDAFNKGAEEPKFTPVSNSDKDVTVTSTTGFSGTSFTTAKNELKAMDYRERHGKQIEYAWNWLKGGDLDSLKKLREVNSFHLEELQKEGLVRNSMTIADFDNFVISRELLSDIQGCRTDYTALVNATEWRETLSLQMAWLTREGDIDMQNVDFCDTPSDSTAGDTSVGGNLKPISEYGAQIRTADLEELAAVTPVCNAATRFLAADLLGDVAAGYRNDYDRKRAQLVVARLQQAVDNNGNVVTYHGSGAEKLTDFLEVWTEIATCTPNGTFVMSTSSYAEVVKQALLAGINGPLAQLFTTGNQTSIFGHPFILVPDDLLPTLGGGSSKTFTVDGDSVTVDNAVFYAQLGNFTGRTSGGLQYDLSTEAAYEVDGDVRSAYQRNELVLRGSFFRGGAVKNEDQVAAISYPSVT